MGYTNRHENAHTQQNDLMSLLLFFQNKENGFMKQDYTAWFHKKTFIYAKNEACHC
jgi:hypothetical protein